MLRGDIRDVSDDVIPVASCRIISHASGDKTVSPGSAKGSAMPIYDVMRGLVTF